MNAQPGTTAAADAATPESAAPDTSKWSWWWSKDQERYSGPHGSRDEALMSAYLDDASPVHVMQAKEGSYRCDLYDVDLLAEQFDEINYDLCDGDGDPPSTDIPKAVWDHLAAVIKSRVRAAVLKHCPTSWAFSGQTAGEWVDFSTPQIAALPAEARQIIADLATGYAFKNGCAPSYVAGEMERLKVVLASPPPPPNTDQDAADSLTGGVR